MSFVSNLDPSLDNMFSSFLPSDKQLPEADYCDLFLPDDFQSTLSRSIMDPLSRVSSPSDDGMRPLPPSKQPFPDYKELLKTNGIKTHAVKFSMLNPESTKDKDMCDKDLPPVLQEQNIKRKRLARKAELARLSRRRKKDRLSDLEEENKLLQDEIARLNEFRQQDQVRLLRLQQERIQEPYHGLKNSSSRQSLTADDCNSDSSLSPQTPKADDFSSSSLNVSSFRLPSQALVYNNSSNANSPSNDLIAFIKAQVSTAESAVVQETSTQFTPLQANFLEWIFSQQESFYEDPEGLWTSLFTLHLAVTPTQLARLHDTRARFKIVAANTQELENLLDKLKVLIRGGSTAANMIELTKILSPAQASALSTWIQRFSNT